MNQDSKGDGEPTLPSQNESSEDDNDYAVGYGKPPPERRFKPGQSGNGKGRPRGSKNHKTILREIMTEMHRVTEGGRRRRRSTLELMLRALCNHSAEGNVRGFRAYRKYSAMFAPQNTRPRRGALVLPAEQTQEEWEIKARQVRDKQKRDEAERLAEEAERERQEKHENGPQ